MIELVAVAARCPSDQLPPETARSTLENSFLTRLPHCRRHQTNNLVLAIAGDRPVDAFFFSSPRLTLICNADLVEPLPVKVSPAELLASLYEQKGDSFTRDLHGWFGVILYDHESGELKAWTDHFGVRRFVYSVESPTPAVASDIRLLTPPPGRGWDIDTQAVVEYLQYSCIPAPRTIYRGIRRLEPGNTLNLRSGSATAYWDMSYPEDVNPHHTDDVWARETEAAVHDAVRRHLQFSPGSHRSGCFLSGGTDSSSVTGLAGQITGEPPRSFSIGFSDPRYNEIEYARIAARAFKADHHEYFVTPNDILDLIPRAVQVYDEPFGNSSIIPSYYCAKLAAAAGVTHLLAGDGGDELFGGNERYVSDLVFQRYRRVPLLMRKGLIEPCLDLLAPIPVLRKASSYVRRANLPAPDRYISYNLPMIIPAGELFSADFLAKVGELDLLEPARRHFRRAPASSELNRWLYLDLKITITDNDLRKVTPMTELTGLTVRYPLLDPGLAEFSGRLPTNFKVRNNQLRFGFKKAMSNLLPADIIKKTKHGFGLPYSAWLGEHSLLKEFTFDTLGSERARQRGYFREDLLEWLWSGYQGIHRGFFGDALWVFLLLELWHGRGIAGPNPNPMSANSG
jgi:asparagine synthase (glutamine-hydrolysing)